MKSVLLLICVALIACGVAEELNQNGLHILKEQNCGVFNEKDLPLHNNEVNPGSRPWMALLNIRIDDKDLFACMGTLITDRFVLTAGHCVNNLKIKSVRLGEHDQSTDLDCRTHDNNKKCLPASEDIDVERVIIHEDFHGPIGANDIALVQLSRKVEFKEHISPICLPINAALQQQVESLGSMLLTGWGAEEDSKNIDILREADLRHADRQNCSQVLRGIKLDQSQFCSYMNGLLCRGTSGSPLSRPVDYLGKQRFVQFGIITFGTTGCTTKTLGVNTNVGSFMPWITRVLAEQPEV